MKRPQIDRAEFYPELIFECLRSLSRTSFHEFYSLDGSIDPNRVTSDQDSMSYLVSRRESWKGGLGRNRLGKPGVCPAPFNSYILKCLRESTAEMKEMATETASDTTAALEGWKTDHGEWSKKNTLAIAHDSPKFMGTKTTLEFIPTGARKAVLGMTQYNMLTPRENSDGLSVDEEVSLCHIFPLEPKKPNGKRCAAGQFNDFAPPPLDEWKEELSNFDMTNNGPLGVDDYNVDVPRRPWDNFTKIYTENPKLMYAACNLCNTMLKLTGGLSCGTKSLINHSKTDTCKKKQQQPGNTSVMHVPSIVLDGHHGITTDGVVEIRGISVEIGEPQ